MGENVGTAEPAPPEPGARSALGHGWGVMTDHFWTFLWMIGVYYVVVGLGVGLRVGVGMAANQVAATIVYGAWIAAVAGPLAAGLGYAYLEAARGRTPGTKELTAGYTHIVPFLISGIILGIAVTVGLVLLVLPGVYLWFRLFFTPLFVIDQDMGAVEALKASWNHTGGHVLSLLGLAVAGAVIFLGGALLLLVGLIPAAIWVGAATSSYYHALVDGGEAAPAGREAEPRSFPEAGDVGDAGPA